MTYDALLTSLKVLQGTIRLDARHSYWINGARVPGVTTVARVLDAPALDAWKVRVQVEGTARAAYLNPPPARLSDEEEDSINETTYINSLVAKAKEQYEHDRISREAADVGSQVHALIEHAVKVELGEETTPPAASDEALFIFAGWREWAKSVDMKPLSAETKLYNAAYNYCGSLDLLCLIGGEPAVVDWKPQERVYPERRLQSVAYRQALRELGWPVMAGYIVALPRDGGAISMVRLDDGKAYQEAWGAFQSCLQLYRWLKALEKAER